MANPAATLPRHTFPEHAITLVRGRPAAGVEGLVAKGAQSHYVPGGRGWVKVKSRHTREVIIGLYAEAERTLSAAEALYRFDMFKRGDAAVPALKKLETEQRKVRLAAGAKLALDLEDAMTSVEEDPGGGWFSGSQRDRVRALARQVRADLPTLGPRALPPGSGSSAF